jgi:hypothetical protein
LHRVVTIGLADGDYLKQAKKYGAKVLDKKAFCEY